MGSTARCSVRCQVHMINVYFLAQNLTIYTLHVHIFRGEKEKRKRKKREKKEKERGGKREREARPRSRHLSEQTTALPCDSDQRDSQHTEVVARRSSLVARRQATQARIKRIKRQGGRPADHQRSGRVLVSLSLSLSHLTHTS